MIRSCFYCDQLVCVRNFIAENNFKTFDINPMISVQNIVKDVSYDLIFHLLSKTKIVIQADMSFVAVVLLFVKLFIPCCCRSYFVAACDYFVLLLDVTVLFFVSCETNSLLVGCCTGNIILFLVKLFRFLCDRVVSCETISFVIGCSCFL